MAQRSIYKFSKWKMCKGAELFVKISQPGAVLAPESCPLKSSSGHCVEAWGPWISGKGPFVQPRLLRLLEGEGCARAPEHGGRNLADPKHSKTCSRCVSGSHGTGVMKWRQEHLIWENWPSGRTFLVALMVKRVPTVLETWVWSLGPDDPLEKEMAIHSSILAWKIPWTKELVGYSLQESAGGVFALGIWSLRWRRSSSRPDSGQAEPWEPSAPFYVLQNLLGGPDTRGSEDLGCLLKSWNHLIIDHHLLLKLIPWIPLGLGIIKVSGYLGVREKVGSTPAKFSKQIILLKNCKTFFFWDKNFWIKLKKKFFFWGSLWKPERNSNCLLCTSF